LPLLSVQFFQKGEDILVVGRSVPHVANNPFLVDDHCPSVEKRLIAGLDVVKYSQPAADIGQQWEGYPQILCPILQRYHIIPADTHDLGVEAVIEVEVPLMTLHFTRSDRGEGGGEKGDDEIVLPIIVRSVIDETVLRR